MDATEYGANRKLLPYIFIFAILYIVMHILILYSAFIESTYGFRKLWHRGNTHFNFQPETEL